MMFRFMCSDVKEKKTNYKNFAICSWYCIFIKEIKLFYSYIYLSVISNIL